MYRVGLIILILLIGCVSKIKGKGALEGIQKGEGNLINSLKCKSGKDERFLAVSETESGGCELSYIKFGERKIIATSIQGTDHCSKVMVRTKSILEAAKFQCS